MVILELKMVIFVLLVGAAALGVAIAWLTRRRVPASDTHHVTPLMAVLEDAPYGLIELEGNTLSYANRYARRLLHLSGTEGALPNADWVPLLDEDRNSDRSSAARRYRTVTFASGQTARWWLMPWEDRDFVFLLDITAQQRTEQAARALLNDLSHELRTPIATILTHLEVLSLADVSKEIQQQSLALSKNEAQRMARLVNDMLELGRLETAVEFPRRAVDLLPLVEDVILQSTPRAVEQRMQLSIEADTPLPMIRGNADRLRQVFLNLLDNAFKYARPDDRITISLHKRETGVLCTICDTGPGIPPEHLPHVSRRFYRAAPQSVEGSGLGLALVSEILRRHESELSIESHSEGRTGTCVRFILPVIMETRQ